MFESSPQVSASRGVADLYCAGLDEWADDSPTDLADQERASFELWEQQYCTPEGQLGQIVDAARGEAMSAGAKLHAVAEFVRSELAKVVGLPPREVTFAVRSAQCEVALALHLSGQAASGLVDLALALSRRLPKTLDALRTGRIPLTMARMLAEETENLTLTQAAEVETAILPKAAGRTPSSLQRMTRRRVLRLDSEAARKRRAAAMVERDVRISETQDGMALLTADLPLETAWEIKNLINATAAQTVPGDTRTIGQRRVDALVDLVLHPDDDSPRTAVVLHLHATTKGDGDTVAEDVPATATGFGGDLDPTAALGAADLVHQVLPVPAAAGTAFDVAAWLADLNSGAHTYTPSMKLARAIKARDKHCRFPGCRVPAARCELDHTFAFRLGGTTVTFNLACVCKFHHGVKHSAGWTCTQDLLGRLTWTTPNGQSYLTYPPPRFEDPPPDFQPTEPRQEPRLSLRERLRMHGPWLPHPTGDDPPF